VDRPQIAVSPVGADRLLALAAVFGRAFVDEPMMVWPMGEVQDRVECFTRCFALFLEVALDLGLVSEAMTQEGQLCGFRPTGSSRGKSILGTKHGFMD
jgi:hypothetical protein